MGYDTYFEGAFTVKQKLDPEVIDMINRFSRSRRMQRDSQKLADALGISLEQCLERYLEEGQLFCEDEDTAVVDHNEPPSQQPGLWCQWVAAECGHHIMWDGGEKFYYYVEWLKYIIKVFLQPRGDELVGEVFYAGDSEDDVGWIVVRNKEVRCPNKLSSSCCTARRLLQILTDLFSCVVL